MPDRMQLETVADVLAAAASGAVGMRVDDAVRKLVTPEWITDQLALIDEMIAMVEPRNVHLGWPSEADKAQITNQVALRAYEKDAVIFVLSDRFLDDDEICVHLTIAELDRLATVASFFARRLEHRDDNTPTQEPTDGTDRPRS